MLQAKNSAGKLVTLANLPKQHIEHLRKFETFYCPACNHPLIIRAGKSVIPHFAHQRKSTCTLSSNGESADHQSAKLHLLQWLRNQQIDAQLEVYLPTIKQRPDILVAYRGRTFAIEYQHTVTNQKIVRQRSEGYQTLNIIPIWLLGANFFKRTSSISFQVTDWTLQFLHQFSDELPTMQYYFSPNQQQILIVHDLYLVNRRRAYANFSFQSLKRLTFKEMFDQEKLSQKQLILQWRREKRNFRLSPEKPFGKELKWRRWLYEQGYDKEQLPSIVHLPITTQHYFNVPPWNWQSRFIIGFLHKLQIGQTFTLQSVHRFLRHFLYQKTDYPLIKAVKSPVLPYLQLLANLHYVKQMDENLFMKHREVIFYDHVEQALAGDDELLRYIMYNHI